MYELPIISTAISEDFFRGRDGGAEARVWLVANGAKLEDGYVRYYFKDEEDVDAYKDFEGRFEGLLKAAYGGWEMPKDVPIYVMSDHSSTSRMFPSNLFSYDDVKDDIESAPNSGVWVSLKIALETMLYAITQEGCKPCFINRQKISLVHQYVAALEKYYEGELDEVTESRDQPEDPDLRS